MKITSVTLRQIDRDRLQLIADYLTVAGEISGARSQSTAIRYAIRVCWETIRGRLGADPTSHAETGLPDVEKMKEIEYGEETEGCRGEG